MKRDKEKKYSDFESGKSRNSDLENNFKLNDSDVFLERHYSKSQLEPYGRKIVERKNTKFNHRVDFSGVGPKGYVRPDHLIQEDVNLALYRNGLVDASEIEVFVRKGIVTLKGSVKSRAQKKEAEISVEVIAGVKDIFNELNIIEDRDNFRNFGRRGLIDNITGLN